MAEKQYERTSAGLRELLFDTICSVKAGKMSGNDGKAIAALAKETIASVDLELRVQRQAKELAPGSEDALTLAPPTIKLLPSA